MNQYNCFVSSIVNDVVFLDIKISNEGEISLQYELAKLHALGFHNVCERMSFIMDCSGPNIMFNVVEENF